MTKKLRLSTFHIYSSLTWLIELQRNGAIRRVWFFQDGATCHKTGNSQLSARIVSEKKVVGLGHSIEWPARPAGLWLLDYFPLGQSEVWRVWTGPNSFHFMIFRTGLLLLCFPLSFFSETIFAKCRTRMARNAVSAMITRAKTWIQNQGNHVEGRAGQYSVNFTMNM